MTPQSTLKNFRRILILGNSGSGKSTLARKIGALHHLPVIHLDEHFFGPDWSHPNPQGWREKLFQLIQQDAWVMDGQRNNLSMRVARSQVVIYLDFSTFLCIFRVIKRRFMAAKSRLGRPENCLDRLTWDFLWYVMTFHRKRKQMLCTLDAYSEGRSVYVIRGRAELKIFENDFLKESFSKAGDAF